MLATGTILKSEIVHVLRGTARVLALIGVAGVILSIAAQQGLLQFLSFPAGAPEWPTVVSYVLNAVFYVLTQMTAVVLVTSLVLWIAARQVDKTDAGRAPRETLPPEDGVDER